MGASDCELVRRFNCALAEGAADVSRSATSENGNSERPNGLVHHQVATAAALNTCWISPALRSSRGHAHRVTNKGDAHAHWRCGFDIASLGWSSRSWGPG